MVHNLSIVQMFCANCGTKVGGLKCADGAVRIECPRCMAKIFSKQKSKREVNIRLSIVF